MGKVSRIGLSLVLASSFAFGDIYNLGITQGTNSFSVGSNNLMDAIEYFDENSLNKQIPAYNPNGDLSATLNMRGLDVTLNMVGKDVFFDVPSLVNSNVSFKQGATRDENINLLEDWFKENGGELLERIMKELARVSPVDPIAGNSNSAMAKNVESDFTNGFLNTASNQRNGTTSSTKNNNLISIDPTFKSVDVGGKTSCQTKC